MESRLRRCQQKIAKANDCKFVAFSDDLGLLLCNIVGDFSILVIMIYDGGRKYVKKKPSHHHTTRSRFAWFTKSENTIDLPEP